MLVLFVGIMIGMALGLFVMLTISWATCLRHENMTIKDYFKDIARTLSCAPEYRKQ